MKMSHNTNWIMKISLYASWVMKISHYTRWVMKMSHNTKWIMKISLYASWVMKMSHYTRWVMKMSHNTNRIQPHEHLPALLVGHVDEVEEFPRPDAVGDVLHVRHRVHEATLLGTQDDAVEVGIDNGRTQPLEFSDDLTDTEQHMKLALV